jgi:hypothetical protein
MGDKDLENELSEIKLWYVHNCSSTRRKGRGMNAVFARELIEHPGEDVTDRLFDGIEGTFWVDCREADADIITLAAKAIGTPDLAPEWIDGKLNVKYRGRLTEIPLKFKPGEQDTTLRVLNKAIAPEIEIRFVKASDGGDTIAFMPLGKDAWSELEAAFGSKVDEAFTRVDENTPFFEEVDEEATKAALKSMKSQMRFVQFSRVNFRVSTREREAGSPAGAGAGAAAVIEPLAGDLVLTYFRDLRPTYPIVTEAGLEEYGMSRKELRELALKNAHAAWRGQLKFLDRDGLFEIVGGATPNGVSMTAPVILYDVVWKAVADNHGPAVVAFPRRDRILYAKTNEPAAVEKLRNELASMAFDGPDALSRLLYERRGDAWRVRSE